VYGLRQAERGSPRRFAGFPATDFPTVKLPAVPSCSPTPPSVRYSFCPSFTLPLSLHSFNCRIHLNNYNRFAKSVSHSLPDHARLSINKADVRDVNIYHTKPHQLLINLPHNRTQHISSTHHPRICISLYPPRSKQSPTAHRIGPNPACRKRWPRSRSSKASSTTILP
jgi:hypothetical protein